MTASRLDTSDGAHQGDADPSGRRDDWDSVDWDNVPSLVPEESTDEHLKILAAIARVFSDDRVRSSIHSAQEPARIREVLAGNRVFG